MKLPRWQVLLLDQGGITKEAFVLQPCIGLLKAVEIVDNTNHAGVMINGFSTNQAEVIQILPKPDGLLIFKPIIITMELADQGNPIHLIRTPNLAKWWKLGSDTLVETAQVTFSVWYDWLQSNNN